MFITDCPGMDNRKKPKKKPKAYRQVRICIVHFFVVRFFRRLLLVFHFFNEPLIAVRASVRLRVKNNK